MTVVDLLWLPPLMLAVAAAVGTAGRRPGQIGPAVRRAFVGLTVGVVAVGIVVRLIVLLFV